ncbi:hypothetical protein EON65_03610 [archaeon]|nr:MAG: hypothetical protein EON65_03610 [archaeon]
MEGSEQQPLLGFNMHGRGFPDVSALAYNYIISVGNQLTAVSGTSASSPVFAGMVSLVNSARLEAGHSNLGWLNPALYQYSSSFVRDITSGDNRCGADAMVCCGHGYFATDGWDPVTGLGAIDFPSFKDTMMSIGVPERVPSLTPTRAPQGPTIHPTRSPALAPTAHPTAAPTMQKGWLYISQYESESCEGRVATMSAVPTDTCLELYGSDQKIAGSVHYVCRGDGTAMVSYYSDATCRKVKQESSIFMGCAYKVANYYDSEEYFSTEVSCTMSSDPTTPPLPAYDGSYGVERSYNSLFGCEGQVSAVEAVLQDYCFNINQRVMSYKLIFPNIVVYDALDCKASKQVSQNPLNLDCKFAIEADDDGFNDDEFGNDGSKLRDAVTMKKGSSLYKQKVDTSMAFDNIHSSQGFTPRGPVKAVRQLNNVELQGDDYYGDDAITDMFNIWAVADVAPLDGASEEPSLFPTHRPTTLLPTMGPLATHLPTYTPTSCLPIVVPTILPSSLPTSVPVHTEPTAPPFGSGNGKYLLLSLYSFSTCLQYSCF